MAWVTSLPVSKDKSPRSSLAALAGRAPSRRQANQLLRSHSHAIRLRRLFPWLVLLQSITTFTIPPELVKTPTALERCPKILVLELLVRFLLTIMLRWCL